MKLTLKVKIYQLINLKKNNSDEKEKNLISNLKYKSFDAMGNEYLINSKSAELSLKKRRIN